MDNTTADHAAGRIRERAAKPMRPPWTYRCYLSRREPGIDVDAFTRDEARTLAASHWSVEPDAVDVEGRRRRWMRWIGRSTHQADWDDPPMDRGWWTACKFAAVGVLCAAAALPIGLVGGEVLSLHVKAKQAELERLESDTVASVPGMEVEAAQDGAAPPGNRQTGGTLPVETARID